MPVSGGGFEQSYNAQASVDTDTMLVVSPHISQAPNDKKEIEPALKKLASLPSILGSAETLLADTGYFSESNVRACLGSKIKPLIAGRRAQHNLFSC